MSSALSVHPRRRGSGRPRGPPSSAFRCLSARGPENGACGATLVLVMADRPVLVDCGIGLAAREKSTSNTIAGDPETFFSLPPLICPFYQNEQKYVKQFFLEPEKGGKDGNFTRGYFFY